MDTTVPRPLVQYHPRGMVTVETLGLDPAI